MRKILLSLFLLLFIMSTEISVKAEASQNMIPLIWQNLDNIFPIHNMYEEFTTPRDPVYTGSGTEAAIESATRNGTREIWMYSNTDGIHEYEFYEKINTGYSKNFFISVDIIPRDIYPYNGGGCSISYKNDFVSGTSNEEPVKIVSLIAGDKILFEIQSEDEVTGTKTEIMDYDRAKGSVNLTIIRLCGETLFYVDSKYVAQITDGTVGPYQLLFGAEIFPDGDTAICSFDNLDVRKVQ